MAVIWAVLLQIGAPLLQVILKLLVQFKIIQTQAEADEMLRRYQAALKAADQAKQDAVSAQKQFNAAKDEAEKKWRDTFGGGQQP